MSDFEKLEPDLVTWVVDPLGDYDDTRGAEIISWLESWDKPFYPSGRFYRIKQFPQLLWVGYQFCIGVGSEAAAKEFNERWGGIMHRGSVTDKGFEYADGETFRSLLTKL